MVIFVTKTLPSHFALHGCRRNAGLKAHPHGLHYPAITHALDRFDVRTVQRFSGHRKLDTLMIYDDNRRDLGGKVAKAVAPAHG